MRTIITFGGSSSRTSINKQLAEYVGEKFENVDLIKIDLNDYDIPLFSVDLEASEGFSADLMKLNAQIEKADAFVISLAEHNGAYTVAFKNAFDWLSRINGKVWREKPMLLLSTSGGARGGKSVLEIAMNRFPRNGGVVIDHLAFPSFYENFVNGGVINRELEEAIDAMVVKLTKAL